MIKYEHSDITFQNMQTFAVAIQNHNNPVSNAFIKVKDLISHLRTYYLFKFAIFYRVIVKETKSATMNIFRNFSFLFKSYVNVELSYIFTINLFTIAENCMEK